jgi:superfamily II RNA helicase
MLSIPSTTTNAVGYPPSAPAIDYTFPLDPWQQQAVLAIHRGDNILVTAKTGSGKTLVGEYQIAYSLKQHKRVFYTTPIKSLSNQKYNDLKHLFPNNSVGIMTGDIKSNPEADIVVMTTEILRNLLFKEHTVTATIGTAGAISMKDVDAVVFDEVHYINDPDRGHVWEETLILLPPQIHLILLSATIDAPELFAGWLGKAKNHPIVLLKTTHRIVPLTHGIYDTSQSPVPLLSLKNGDEAPYTGQTYLAWLRSREKHLKDADDWKAKVDTAKRAGDSLAGSAHKVKLQSFTHSLNECVSTLKDKDLLPALFFIFSRKECERYANQITGSLIDSTQAASVKHIIKFHLHKYATTLETLPQYHQITSLLERGIAFHHSGLLPLLKEIVEILFAKGFIKVLFCTETFAVGLNMPARTVVFLDLKKPGDGTGFRPLRPDEYIQMAGRAGRRGKDTRGIVLYLPARDPVEPQELQAILSGKLLPLESRLQFHYDFILKAIHTTQANQTPVWEAVVDRSYWSEQQARHKEELTQEIILLKEKQAALPLTDTERQELATQANLQDRVKSSTNAAKKKANQELEQWKNKHMGPKWANAAKFYQTWTTIDTQIERLTIDINTLNQSITTTRIQPILDALADWGALTVADAVTTPTLTSFGILATEANEGNPLLMAKLYESQLLKGATATEIVGTLAAFIVDREAESKTVHPSALSPAITQNVKSILCQIDEWGCKGVRIDQKHYIQSPSGFWNLTTLWVEIATAWMKGAEACELSKTHDIYEGNLMRGLHKVASITNEWISMLTYKADVDMLHTLKDVQNTLLRDIAQPESLYLRI